MNFRQLIDRHARYRDKTLKPRSMASMAKKCGVSRAHLYNFFNGAKVAPEWTVARIAQGLGVDAKVVQRALNKSRKEALES